MAKHKQTILITGAGRRIGATLAEHLARSGRNLVLHYATSKAAALRVATRCTKLGAQVTLVQADLCDAAACQKLWKSLPPVTALIHNASLFRRDTLATMKASDVRHHLALHVEAPLLLAQGFMKQLPKKSAGNIILIGDGAMGWSVAPQFFSYAVSKHALTSTIDILAAAVAPRARANVIAPGPTLMGVNDTKHTFAKLASIAPLKRTSDPSEICAAVDYLLAAPGVTGQVLALANGFCLNSARRLHDDSI